MTATAEAVERMEKVHHLVRQWALWMRKKEHKLGHRRKVPLLRAPENVWAGDSVRQYDRLDMGNIVACDSAINDMLKKPELQPIYWSLQRRFGLGSMIRYGRRDLD